MKKYAEIQLKRQTRKLRNRKRRHIRTIFQLYKGDVNLSIMLKVSLNSFKKTFKI